MSRGGRLGLCLAVGLSLLAAPLAGSSPGHVFGGSEAPPPSSSGGTLTGTISDPTGAYLPAVDYLRFTITGADLKRREGTASSYLGTVAGKTITLRAEMSVTIATGYVSYVNMSARLGTKSTAWPPAGVDNKVTGRTVTQSFNLTFKVGVDTPDPGGGGTYVSGGAKLSVCGGICAGYAVDFIATFAKPPPTTTTTPSTTAKPPPPLKADRPLALAWEVKTPYPLRPGTYAWLPYSVRDRSGKAKVHAALYEGGEERFQWASKYFLTADGRHQNWKVHLSPSLRGPLFFCVWAENPGGKQSLNAPKSDCAFLSFLVDIKRVSNGCGGEGWDSIVWVENYFGNVHTYYDPGTGSTYRVSFVDACDLHDAGYAGVTVEDKINGGPAKDMHAWTRKMVDDEFWRNMKTLCDRQIPPAATIARQKCKGVGGSASIGSEWLYDKVRSWGNRFFDADLQTPGTQKLGSRSNA